MAFIWTEPVTWWYCVVLFTGIAAQNQCIDYLGQSFPHGAYYVISGRTCLLCVCDNGHPTLCKTVVCSQPKDCESFRVGKECCQYICLDNRVKPENIETNIHMAAGGAAAVIIITVALIVYRVKKQKRRRPLHGDDQRSLTSIGYISGSMGYMGNSCEPPLDTWKPSGNYLPQGEAPPPYEEVVSQCRAETMRVLNESSYHRTYPTAAESVPYPDNSVQYAGHTYISIPRTLAQIPNTQNCYNAPLLQQVHQPEGREPTSMPHYSIVSTIGFPSAIRLTGSLGAISNRGLVSVLQREPDHERPQNVPGFYTNTSNVHTLIHRTIPRISTDTTLLDTQISRFNRADRSLHNEIRRSFHKPSDNNRQSDTGRSMPRNLNLASANDITKNGDKSDDTCGVRLTTDQRVRAHSEEQNMDMDAKSAPAPPADAESPATPAPPAAPVPPTAPVPPAGSAPPAAPAPTAMLPLTVDKPSCVCSYEGSAAPGAEDADDYRSECENCKSASSSRWVLEDAWEGEAEDGTQTLQHRAPPPPPPPPSTATLPQPVTKQTRTAMGPPSNWENWFNTIPDSDTETEDE